MSQHIFENSGAANEPMKLKLFLDGFSLHFQYNLEIPSSSVSYVSHLWQKALVESENIDLFSAEKYQTSKSVSHEQKNTDLQQLLNSWREGDEEEQRDTLEYLRKVLDEDRLSNRKLFP